jgi:hypothetical protein
MTTTAPTRSTDQRQNALDRANEIRFKRSDLRAELHDLTRPEARSQVAKLIESPPAFLLTMKIESLLLLIPRFGDVKVRKIMWAHQISPRKRIGGLSQRQRLELAAVLRRDA